MNLVEVMPEEQAQLEIQAFLDSKYMMPKRRKQIEGQIETLVEAMQYGNLIISDDKITHNLIVPITSGVSPLTCLEWKKRVASDSLRNKIKKLDILGQFMAVGLMCQVNPNIVEAIIDKLEQPDRAIYDSLCMVFFPS